MKGFTPWPGMVSDRNVYAASTPLPLLCRCRCRCHVVFVFDCTFRLQHRCCSLAAGVSAAALSLLLRATHLHTLARNPSLLELLSGRPASQPAGVSFRSCTATDASMCAEAEEELGAATLVDGPSAQIYSAVRCQGNLKKEASRETFFNQIWWIENVFSVFVLFFLICNQFSLRISVENGKQK